MFSAICKLLAAVLFGGFIVWVTFEIGIGLDCWGPFIAAMIGLIGGSLSAVVKLKEKKDTDR